MSVLAELFPGYAVEKLEEKDDFDPAYKVTGPKKTWFLMRNRVNPSMLFPHPEHPLSGQFKIRGYEWFTDKDGDLKPVR